MTVYYTWCNTRMPKTPVRAVRIADALYERAKAKAAERGETVADIIRRALERYLKS